MIIALGLFASGCSISVDAAPTQLNASHTAELALPPPTDAPSASTGNGSPFPVYLIRDGKLVAIQRYYNRPSPRTALLALDFGPLTSEIRRGISTEIAYTPNAQVSWLSTNASGIATVELDSQFEPPNLIGTHLAQAFAQIVYTLTAPDAPYGVKGVVFDLTGIHWPAYLPDGESRFNTPVSYVDYAALGP